MLVSVRGNGDVTAVNVEVAPNLNELLATVVVVDGVLLVLNTKLNVGSICVGAEPGTADE
jgi:hypothetical protein